MVFLRSLLTSVVFLTFFLSNLYAQITTVQLTVKTSDNQILSGVYVVAKDSTGQTIDFATTNDLGIANFFQLQDVSSTSFEADPSLSYDCTGCGIYKKTSTDTIILDPGAANAGIFNAGNLSLVVADYIVEVTVVNKSGTPVSGAEVSGYSETDPSSYGYATTDSNGKASFAAASGEYSVSVYSPNQTFTDAYKTINITATGTTSTTLEVSVFDSSIKVNLITSNGSAYTIPTSAEGEEFWAGISCNEEPLGGGFVENPKYGYTNLQAGSSSGTVNLVQGRYRCYVHIHGVAASSVVVDLDQGENATAESTVQVANHTVRVFFTNNGTPVSMNASIYAFIDNGFDGTSGSGLDHYADAFEAESDGGFTLKLLAGQKYFLGFSQDTGVSELNGSLFVSSDTNYIADQQHKSIETNESSPQTVNFPVSIADMTITGSVVNNGKGVANTWVDLFCGSFEFNEDGTPAGDQFFTGTITNSSGEFSLAGRSGKTCHLSAWLPFELIEADPTLLHPAPQEFQGTAGAKTFNLEAAKADLTLSVTIKEPESASKAFDWAYCVFFGEKHAGNFVDFNNLEGLSSLATKTVGLVSGPVYQVHCEAYQGNEFYYSDATYNSGNASNGTDSVTYTLAAGGTYYAPESKSFTVSNTNKMTLADGESTVEFPANFISSSKLNGETQATFVASTSDSKLQGSENQVPFKPWKLNVLVSGQQYTEAFDKSVTLKLVYDVSDFPEGTDVTKLTGCLSSVKGSESAVQNTQCTVEVSSDGKKVTMTATTDHFSNFGLNFASVRSNETEGPTETAPTTVKAKKAKAKGRKASKATSAKITWSKVTNATSYIVKISKLVNDETTTETKTIKASKKKGKNQSKTFKLKKSGSYGFSVAAVVDGVTSAYTAAKKTIKVKGKKNKKKKKKNQS